MTQAKTICLVMIVRNEAAVIRRCLESVKPYIDCWVICDTGSTDATKEIIRENLASVPGTLYEDAWVAFDHNRILAIARARGRADYYLLINADETLQAETGLGCQLGEDAYVVRFTGPTDYWVTALVSDRFEWKYFGVTHEYIQAVGADKPRKLQGVTLTHHFDGGSRANKYERDIALLTKALEADPQNARYMFYLAQSYRDAGYIPQAIDWYARRATAGAWEEEVFYSLYQVARLQALSTLPWPIVLNSYLIACQYRPARIEPIFQIVKYYRENQHYHLGYLFARSVVDAPYPDDILFIERSVYEYELPLEYGICCYWTGRHEEAIRVNEAILATPNVPPDFLETASKNRQFSVAVRSGL